MPKTEKKSPAIKKPKLDIKDQMYWADKKRFDWLESQSEDLRKTFSPLIAMKWFSVSSRDPDYYIWATNEFLNTNDFWTFSSKHPDLVWRLMCAIGKPYNASEKTHGWIQLSHSRKTVGKVDAVLLSVYPSLNDSELDILKRKFTKETFKNLLIGLAFSDAEIKPLLDEYKKNYD